ncbi:hypothetical protein SADUNF_Sadunf14G0033700 [Salix dunnii]|uniref:Uncharacterized protein n=1 Tax=Salix dunnii TaxID=1413687 RepID=A0A835JEJ0_9ROSI|nr:hypothetical protein SADUNF_Sadunf14G0033700 [Salix dunnii]
MSIPEMRRTELRVKTDQSAAKTSPRGNDGAIHHEWPSTVFPHQKQWKRAYGTLTTLLGMVNLIVDSTTSILLSWERRTVRDGGIADINVDLDMRSLSADTIPGACFGSNDAEGKENSQSNYTS